MAVFQPWKRKEILQPHSQETGRPINRPITSLSALFTRPLQTVLPRSILPGRISCWAPSCSGTGSFRYFESSRLRETEMMIYPSNNRIRAENLQILSGVHISLANWKKWRERVSTRDEIEFSLSAAVGQRVYFVYGAAWEIFHCQLFHRSPRSILHVREEISLLIDESRPFFQ